MTETRWIDVDFLCECGLDSFEAGLQREVTALNQSGVWMTEHLVRMSEEELKKRSGCTVGVLTALKPWYKGGDPVGDRLLTALYLQRELGLSRQQASELNSLLCDVGLFTRSRIARHTVGELDRRVGAAWASYLAPWARGKSQTCVVC